MNQVLSNVYRRGAALLFLTLAFPLSLSAQQVTREAWLSSMETVLPSYICQDGQYFRECFDVKPEECQQVMAETTKVCLDKIAGQIPELLTQPQDGTFWGTKVGACAGNDYEVQLKAKRIFNAPCSNPANWTGG